MLDNARTVRMERNMIQRFGRVAKRFGAGINKALRFTVAGGAIAMLAAAIIDPIREADEKVNAILAKIGDLNTRARQFGTDISNYAAFQSGASAKGIDEGDLITILTRIQTLVSAAKAGDNNVLSQFKDETDMVKVFIEITKALQAMDTASRINFEKQIFGQRQIGKVEDFIMSPIEEFIRNEITRGFGKSNVQNRLTQGYALSEFQQYRKAEREFNDLISTTKAIQDAGGKSLLAAQDELERGRNNRTNKQIDSFEVLSQMQNDIEEILLSIKLTGTTLIALLSPLTEALKTIAEYMPGIAKFLNKWLGGKDDYRNDPKMKAFIEEQREQRNKDGQRRAEVNMKNRIMLKKRGINPYDNQR